MDDAPKHTIFKNWIGCLLSMEPMAIVEGFLLSKEMYKVRYSKLIADGDSSCTLKFSSSDHNYDTIIVKKVECRNHLLRNYFNKLREIAVTSCKMSSDKEDNINRGLT